MIASLPSTVGFLGHLLEVSATLLDQAQILVLDHGMRFRSHVVRNGQPVSAKMGDILVKVLQL
jgi:hypothetical protein